MSNMNPNALSEVLRDAREDLEDCLDGLPDWREEVENVLFLLTALEKASSHPSLSRSLRQALREVPLARVASSLGCLFAALRLEAAP